MAAPRRQSLVSRALLCAVVFYQRSISPLLPARCIYYPTCSEYAYVAIRKYGALKGSWLAVRRILRCHPLHNGGYDPVP